MYFFFIVLGAKPKNHMRWSVEALPKRQYLLFGVNRFAVDMLKETALLLRASFLVTYANSLN
jgi:hypothetical protein